MSEIDDKARAERQLIIDGMLRALENCKRFDRMTRMIHSAFQDEFPEHRVQVLEPRGGRLDGVWCIAVSRPSANDKLMKFNPSSVIVGILSSEKNWQAFLKEHLETISMLNKF